MIVFVREREAAAAPLMQPPLRAIWVSAVSPLIYTLFFNNTTFRNLPLPNVAVTAWC